MFKAYDTDESGSIDLAEFTDMIVKLGIAPKKMDGTEGDS
jgi:Ca2+-binding EF-hand superfamily protein